MEHEARKILEELAKRLLADLNKLHEHQPENHAIIDLLLSILGEVNNALAEGVRPPGTVPRPPPVFRGGPRGR